MLEIEWVPISNVPRSLLRPTAAHDLAYGLRFAVERPSERFKGTQPSARLAGRIGEVLGAAWVREALLHATPYGHFHAPFRIVREWVRLGLCERPEDDWYVLAFMANLKEHGDPDLVTCLRRDRGLLEHEVWRLFAIEGESDCCLAGIDKYQRDGWTDTILRLVRDGDLPRARVLDEALGALARDFPQFRAGWFSRLHDALEPTATEIVSRRDAYLRLLGVRIQPTVALAARALEVLDRENALAAQDLITHARPALRVRAAKTVSLVLSLIERAVEREPALVTDLLELSTEALLHEKPSTQERAVRLLERSGSPDDPVVRTAVSRCANTIAPTLVSRLAPWCGDAVPAAAAPALPERPRLAPLVADDRRVEPLDDPMELVTACSRVMQDASDAVQLERVLDGLSRHGAAIRATDPSLLAPLGERALRTTRRRPVESDFWWIGGSGREGGCARAVEEEIARLVRAWTRGKDDVDEPFDALDEETAPRLAVVLFRRFREIVAVLRAGTGVQLHSTPTHTGGWIDPDALAARRRADPRGAGPADRELAGMRVVPPGGHAGMRVRPADALDVEVEKVVSPNGYVWHRVKLARAERGSLRVDDAVRHLLRAYHGAPSILRLLTISAPSDPLVLVALGLDRLGNRLEVKLTRGDAALFLEPFLEPWRPIDGPAARLVALALSASDPAPHTMALDVILAGGETGRLPAATLGAALAFWLPHGLIRPRRWARLLREASEVSPSHARYVAHALASALRGEPRDAPRDLWALLEVLVQSLAACGESLTDAEAASYLGRLTLGGKTDRLARALVGS